MKKKIFDFKKYELAQIIDALNCPLNRHSTRIKHNCDDWHLYRNPGLLITHYIENGGAAEFTKRRAEFVKEVEVEDFADPNMFLYI